MFVIVYRNIKSFIHNAPVVFSLFTIGIFISVIALLFTSSVMVSIKEYNNRYSPMMRTVVINRELSVNDVDNLATDLDSNGYAIKNITVLIKGEPIKANVYPSDYSKLFVEIGSYFQGKDFSQGKKQVVSMPNDFYVIGSTLKLFNQDYEIIGVFSVAEQHEVPYTSLPHDCTFDEIQIECTKSLTSKEGQNLINHLENIYDHIFVPENPAVNTQLLTEYGISVLIIIMALLNVLFLYLYILSIRRQEFIIFRISGCSIAKGIRIFIYEISLYATVIYLICALVYHFALSSLIGNLGEGFTYSLDVSHYVILYVLFLLMVLIIFSPFIYRYCKSSIAALLKKK